MNLLTLAAIGAGLYFLNQSKSPANTNKKSEPEKEDDIVFKSKEVKPSIDKPIIPPKKFGLSSGECSVNQFKSEGVCKTFWDDNTEGLVLAKIREKAQKFINSQNPKPTGTIGKDYITPLCIDPDVDTYNPHAMNIIKETIRELWPIVKKDDFPVTQNSIPWLITVWNRVVEIYYREICQS